MLENNGRGGSLRPACQVAPAPARSGAAARADTSVRPYIGPMMPHYLACSSTRKVCSPWRNAHSARGQAAKPVLVAGRNFVQLPHSPVRVVRCDRGDLPGGAAELDHPIVVDIVKHNAAVREHRAILDPAAVVLDSIADREVVVEQ